MMNKIIYPAMFSQKGDIERYLMESVRFGQNVTLLDVFRLVDKHLSLKNFISKSFSCNYIDGYHAEAEKPSTIRTGLKYLEISWGVDIHNNKLDIDSVILSVNEEGLEYDITLLPLNEISRLPLRLSEEIVIGKEKYNREFSLLEVLYAIYWEISFVGSIHNRNQITKILADTVSNIESSNLKPDDSFEEF